MDNIQENQEYINPQEYGSVPLNTQNFSLKPPKRLMSAYACFSRKVSPFLSPLTRRFNAKQMALFFLNLNECDLKGTIDVVRETINLISTTDLSVGLCREREA